MGDDLTQSEIVAQQTALLLWIDHDSDPLAGKRGSAFYLS